ncbi:FCD domain-containing protein [Breoghania sp.]|uniref:GntR family transcriptional regulator n=1 Tax=Breoghania sp. TaxID=2065378 RepID=UPI00260E4251|nr:FCD domain-containing protein [Breoghania sp.]MDJ0930586.1 FCD domain-containing protein [Breoghania sp.]
MRQAIECLAAQRATENGPTPELLVYRDLMEQSRQPEAEMEWDNNYNTGHEFHIELVRASGNALLLDIYLPLRARYNILTRLARFYDKEWILKTVDDHLAILQAVIDRDPERAHREMSEHLERSYQSKLKIVGATRRTASFAGAASVIPPKPRQ